MATLDNLEEASATSLPIIPRYFPSASNGVDGCEKDEDISTGDNFEEASDICRLSILFTTNYSSWGSPISIL